MPVGQSDDTGVYKVYIIMYSLLLSALENLSLFWNRRRAFEKSFLDRSAQTDIYAALYIFLERIEKINNGIKFLFYRISIGHNGLFFFFSLFFAVLYYNCNNENNQQITIVAVCLSVNNQLWFSVTSFSDYIYLSFKCTSAL